MSSRELGVTSDGPCTVNQEGDGTSISQQLKEVVELVSSTNQRIEDCAVEWQAKISQAQWRILDAKPIDNKPWEQSVLARTYFADKILDDAFQGLLKHNKTFTDHLHNFVALVGGGEPTMTTMETCNAQNQCSEFRLGSEEQTLPHSSLPTTLKFSTSEENSNARKGRKGSNNGLLNKARQSFTNLIKAKIDFDTKFLGFEATLNGNICAISDPSLSLCQICSKVLGCEPQKITRKNAKIHKNMNLYQRKMRRSSRIKQKRLNSGQSTFRSKGKKVSENIAKKSAPEISCLSDQSVVTTGEM